MADKPERVIALIAGESGTGKSFAVANLHNALIFDTDIGGGLAYLDKRIAANGSLRVEVGSWPEVMGYLNQNKRLLSTITTLVPDHLSTLHQESCIRHNPRDERDFGRSGEIATREWRRFREFVRLHDFNLICVSHLKTKWEAEKATGMVADAAKNLEGDMHISIELRAGASYPSTAWVKKWRRDPEDERGPIPRTFPFTMENFSKLAGAGLLAPREPVKLCSEVEGLHEKFCRLLDVAKLPEGTVEKWLRKAGVDSFLEMAAPDVEKCMAWVEKLLADASTPATVTTTKKGK